LDEGPRLQRHKIDLMASARAAIADRMTGFVKTGEDRLDAARRGRSSFGRGGTFVRADKGSSLEGNDFLLPARAARWSARGATEGR
jgi:hypothetical protein